MSINIMQRIWWREDLTATEKWVGVALADNANEHGVCWPSIRTLMRKTSLSRSAIQKVLAKFEGARLLRRHLRHDSSTIYIFVVENLPLIEPPAGDKEDFLPGLDPAHQKGGTPPTRKAPPPPTYAPPAHQEGPEPSTEPSIEPSLFSGDLASPGGDEKSQVPEIVEPDIVDVVAARWNVAAEKHPGIQKARLPLDDARKQAIRNRSTRTEEGQTVEQLWDAFFDQIERSTFLQGREPPGQGRSDPFKLSMTWALKSANFNEIMEGKYGRAGNRSGPTHDGTGRRMGPAEQATAGALARIRASREQRPGRGGAGGGHG